MLSARVSTMFSPQNFVNVLLRGVGLCSDIKRHFLVVVNILLCIASRFLTIFAFSSYNASCLGILLQKIPKYTIYVYKLATVLQ